MRKRAVFLTFILFLTGCVQKSVDRPPSFRYGQDLCQECHMIISEEAYSCALTIADGETKKFDDIGCMKRYEKKRVLEKISGWAHDQESGRWIPAQSAWYSVSKDLRTPMGSGAAAHFERPESKKTYSWEELGAQLEI